MPLIAITLVLGSLLPASLPTFGLVAAKPPSSAPAVPRTSAGSFGPDTGKESAPRSDVRWVAPHVETPLRSEAGHQSDEIGVAHSWAPLAVIGAAKKDYLPVRDLSDSRRGWVRAADVGPVDPALAGGAHVPPIGQPIAWSGPALVTMYTCVELGGCGPTASGIWPEPGLVAVDPAVIPLGSTVWIQGLGTFLAADTGSLVRGAHLDVFGWSYQDAIAWGIQERTVLVFALQ